MSVISANNAMKSPYLSKLYSSISFNSGKYWKAVSGACDVRQQRKEITKYTEIMLLSLLPQLNTMKGRGEQVCDSRQTT